MKLGWDVWTLTSRTDFYNGISSNQLPKSGFELGCKITFSYITEVRSIFRIFRTKAKIVLFVLFKQSEGCMTLRKHYY